MKKITTAEADILIWKIKKMKPGCSVCFVDGNHGQWLRYDEVIGGKYCTKWVKLEDNNETGES